MSTSQRSERRKSGRLRVSKSLLSQIDFLGDSSEEINKRNSHWWKNLDYTNAPRESLFNRNPSLLNRSEDIGSRLNPEHVSILMNNMDNTENMPRDFNLRNDRRRPVQKISVTPPEQNHTETTEKQTIFNRRGKKTRRYSKAFDRSIKSPVMKNIQAEGNVRVSDSSPEVAETSIQGRKRIFTNRIPIKRNFSQAFSDPPILSTSKRYSNQVINKNNNQLSNVSKNLSFSDDSIKSFNDVLTSTRIYPYLNSPELRKRGSLFQTRLSYLNNSVLKETDEKLIHPEEENPSKQLSKIVEEPKNLIAQYESFSNVNITSELEKNKRISQRRSNVNVNKQAVRQNKEIIVETSQQMSQKSKLKETMSHSPGQTAKRTQYNNLSKREMTMSEMKRNSMNEKSKNSISTQLLTQHQSKNISQDEIIPETQQNHTIHKSKIRISTQQESKNISEDEIPEPQQNHKIQKSKAGISGLQQSKSISEDEIIPETQTNDTFQRSKTRISVQRQSKNITNDEIIPETQPDPLKAHKTIPNSPNSHYTFSSENSFHISFLNSNGDNLIPQTQLDSDDDFHFVDKRKRSQLVTSLLQDTDDEAENELDKSKSREYEIESHVAHKNRSSDTQKSQRMSEYVENDDIQEDYNKFLNRLSVRESEGRMSGRTRSSQVQKSRQMSQIEEDTNRNAKTVPENSSKRVSNSLSNRSNSSQTTKSRQVIQIADSDDSNEEESDYGDIVPDKSLQRVSNNRLSASSRLSQSQKSRLVTQIEEDYDKNEEVVTRNSSKFVSRNRLSNKSAQQSRQLSEIQEDYANTEESDHEDIFPDKSSQPVSNNQLFSRSRLSQAQKTTQLSQIEADNDRNEEVENEVVVENSSKRVSNNRLSTRNRLSQAQKSSQLSEIEEGNDRSEEESDYEDKFPDKSSQHVSNNRLSTGSRSSQIQKLRQLSEIEEHFDRIEEAEAFEEAAIGNSSKRISKTRLSNRSRLSQAQKSKRLSQNEEQVVEVQEKLSNSRLSNKSRSSHAQMLKQLSQIEENDIPLRGDNDSVNIVLENSTKRVSTNRSRSSQAQKSQQLSQIDDINEENEDTTKFSNVSKTRGSRNQSDIMFSDQELMLKQRNTDLKQLSRVDEEDESNVERRSKRKTKNSRKISDKSLSDDYDDDVLMSKTKRTLINMDLENEELAKTNNPKSSSVIIEKNNKTVRKSMSMSLERRSSSSTGKRDVDLTKKSVKAMSIEEGDDVFPIGNYSDMEIENMGMPRRDVPIKTTPKSVKSSIEKRVTRSGSKNVGLLDTTPVKRNNSSLDISKKTPWNLKIAFSESATKIRKMTSGRNEVANNDASVTNNNLSNEENENEVKLSIRNPSPVISSSKPKTEVSRKTQFEIKKLLSEFNEEVRNKKSELFDTESKETFWKDVRDRLNELNQPSIPKTMIQIKPTANVSKPTKQNFKEIMKIIKNSEQKSPKQQSIRKYLEVQDDVFAFMKKRDEQKKITQRKTVPKPIPEWKCLPNGEVVSAKPKLYRKQNWMTEKFYKHLENILEPKFAFNNTLRAEEIMKQLDDVTRIVVKSKKYETKAIDELKFKMAKYGIVETTHQFYLFILKWLPFNVQECIVPMALPKIHNEKFKVPCDNKMISKKILG